MIDCISGMNNSVYNEIKSELVKSCLTNSPKQFIPFLLNAVVKTNMPNKVRFYKFFKHMLTCTDQNSVGNLKLKIENANWHCKNSLSYNFYDQRHLHPRLRIIVCESKSELYIETMPF